MKTNRIALVLMLSAGVISSCTVDTGVYDPNYVDVYAAGYGDYPSYNYNNNYYSNYTPVYSTVGWAGAYYGGGWGPWGHHGGWGGRHGGWGGYHGGGRR